MQIVFFLTYDYSFELWEKSGNLSREIRYFKEFQKKNKSKIYFITFGVSNEKTFEKFIPNSTILNSYDFIKYSSNKFIRFLKSFILPFYLYKYFKFKQIDIIKQNQIQGSWISLILKFLLKKPLIIRTGYDAFSFKIHENKNKLVIFFYYLLTKFSLKYSDIYTVTSLTDFEFLNAKFKNIDSKLKIRRNFVDINDSVNLGYRESNKIITVGRLENQKNYKFIINELKDFKLIIEHFGEGSELTQLEESLVNKNIKINFNSTLENKILTKTYGQFKYFISASFFEGNPKTILEAMASGCIVLASKNKNTNELIIHGNNGFLFDLKKGELKNLLGKVLDYNNTYLESISKNAINSVKVNNSLKILINNESKDLLSLLNCS